MRPFALLCVAGALGLGACGGSSGSRSTSSGTASAPAPVSVAPPPHRPRHHGPPPWSLPQTHQLPSAATATFHAEMRALWRAVVSGSVRPGLRAFFPERAYAQVKAIADPAADYQNRLIAEYALDVGAAHALLGAGARSARLLEVRVDSGYAHWVDPGTCYNRVGYYEVPNARVVYRVRGATRSFGIASMISWRGVWYVVHLGAVTRQGGGGVVDDPSAGPGVSAASSTC